MWWRTYVLAMRDNCEHDEFQMNFLCQTLRRCNLHVMAAEFGLKLD